MKRSFRDILEISLPMTWVVLGLSVLLVVLWGWFSSGLVIKQERCLIDLLPGAFGAAFEDVAFEAADGVPLAGWFVPAAPLSSPPPSPQSFEDRPRFQGAQTRPHHSGDSGHFRGTSTPSDTTIVLCHGWGANRSDILPHTVFLNKRGGYNLFYFDFRNHGESGGNLSSLGAFEARDLEAALNWLEVNRPERTRRIGVYGLSMGGAVALSVTARDPRVAAVAAESPFSSYNGAVARFAKLFYRLPRMPFVPLTLLFVRARLGIDPEAASPVHTIDAISPRPLFLIQGDKDVRMPPSEGETLYARAKEPKTLWTIPGADHGECSEKAGEEYQERLLKFYEGAFAGETSKVKS